MGTKLCSSFKLIQIFKKCIVFYSKCCIYVALCQTFIQQKGSLITAFSEQKRKRQTEAYKSVSLAPYTVNLLLNLKIFCSCQVIFLNFALVFISLKSLQWFLRCLRLKLNIQYEKGRFFKLVFLQLFSCNFQTYTDI